MYMIGVQITMENWSAVDSASGIVFPKKDGFCRVVYVSVTDECFVKMSLQFFHIHRTTDTKGTTIEAP